MNQILEPDNNLKEDMSNENKDKLSKKNKSVTKYMLQFFVSSFVAVIFVCIFLVNSHNENEKEELSQDLLSTYHVSTLYSNSTNSSVQRINGQDNNTNSLSNNELTSNYTSSPFVIGMIRIDKIGLNYPILSQTNSDYLKISLSRFAGPMPNEVGNLCIAGHNYVDYKFFSRLNELEIGDKIKIYDLDGKLIEYIVYDKYETKPTNLSCTNQNTNGKILITLLTCNNVNGKRLVIKARPITN